MLKRISEWASTGFILSSAAGTLLHFIHGWFGDFVPVMILGSLNESPWEHLKLLFWPVFFFTLIEFIAWGHSRRGFIFSRILSVCAGMFLILTVFYTYSGIIGRHLPAVDISLFFLSMALTYLLSTSFLKKNRFEGPVFQILGLGAAFLMISLFVAFTFDPPELPLFKGSSMACCGFF